MSNPRGKEPANLIGRSQDSQDLAPADIWKFLLRRRLLVLAGVALGLVIGLVAYVRAPRLYTSTVTVEMNKDATSGLGLQDLSGAGSAIGIGQDFMTDMLTQQAVLSNKSTALSVISQLNLMSTPPYSQLTRLTAVKGSVPPVGRGIEEVAAVRDSALSLFKSKLQVMPVKNTRLLTISYTDPDPARASQVANATVEAYLLNHTRTRYEATTRASTWLNEQLTDLKRQAEDVHRRVAAMESDSGIFSASLSSSPGSYSKGARSLTGGGELPSESVATNPELEQLMTLSQELSRAQLVRIQQGVVYRLSQTSDPGALLEQNGARLAMSDGTALASGTEGIQLIESLRVQEASLKTRLAAERVTYAAKNPVLLELQNQIDAIKGQIEDEVGRLRVQVKKDYDLAQANENILRRQMEIQQAKVAGLGNKLAALAFLREEEGTSRRLYQDLYTRLQEANIAAGVRSSGMAVVDPARPPSDLASPNLPKDIGAGLAGGLLFGLLLGSIQQLRDTTLNAPEEFEERLPYPILGVVPGFENDAQNSAKEQVEDQAWILRAPRSQTAEAYRTIRTSILLSRTDKPPKVILFTSPVSGDGKSTTAYNLAVAFAVQPAKVLILDADMRRSSIGRLAGCIDPKGLSDILSGGMSFDAVVQVNPKVPGLHILLAGAAPPDPSELLGSKRFVALLSELRERFDYILIDAPPALLVTDPVVTSAVADGVIVVVRAGTTQKPMLRRLSTTLDNSSTHVLGFILNDFNRRLQSYGYGYGGYSGAKYSQYYGSEKGNV